MQIGISANSYQRLLDVVHMGFDHVQLGFLSAQDLERAVDLQKSIGLDVSVHCPLPNASLPGREPFDLTTTSSSVVNHTRRVLLSSIHSAYLLGSSRAIIHFPSAWTLDCPTTLEETVAIGVERISHLCDQALRLGITILVENSGPNPCFYKGSHYAQLIKSVCRDNVGLCLDLGHLHLASMVGRVDEEEFIHHIRPYTRQVHAWNTSSLDDYIRTHTHHLPSRVQDPAKGWLDFPAAAQILRTSPVREVILETNSSDRGEVLRAREYVEELFSE